MASPFRVFRRNQKLLMAVACVVGIFAFVLDDSLRLLMGGSTTGGAGQAGNRPKPNAVAVHWNGGRLTNAELDQLVYRRRILNGFLREIQTQGDQAEIMLARTTGAQPRAAEVPSLLRPETPEQGVEENIVAVRLFADAARKAGITVSDEIINHYLDELGRGHVSREQMRSLTQRSQASHSGVSADYIFDALREEMLAYNFQASHAFAAESIMPQQRWQDWRRVNDRVVIEAAAFPAETFLIDVKEPTDEELTAFYEKYKNDEPLPDLQWGRELPSPRPAFRTPRKIDVQYVRADFDKLLAKLKAEVTDEEVQTYYDKNKDPYFIKLDTALIDKEAEKKDGDNKEADKKETDAKEAEVKPAGGSDAKSAPPEGKQPEGKQPAATPAGGAATEKSGGTTRADKKQSASAQRQNVFQFAAFEQQTPDTKSETPAKSGGATTAAAAQTDASKTEQPTVDPNVLQLDKQPETPKKPIEYEPLDDKLRDKIRTELATPKVHERLNQLTTELQAELNTEFNNYFRAMIDAQELKQPVPPPPAALADLSTLAARHDLEFRKTEPMSKMELREDKVIGRLLDVERSSSQQIVPLFSTLFTKDSDLFKAVTTVDVDNNRYIVIKTSDTPQRVPPLDEIRDNVVRAWRLDKASAIAVQRAEDWGKKADAGGATLTAMFADDPTIKVVRTDPFGWLTGGDVAFLGGQLRQQPYRMSEPDGLVAAGPELMDKVFTLDEGKTGVVLNHNHSIAYLLRLAEHQFAEDKLREMYLAEANTWNGERAMTQLRAREAINAINDSVINSAGLVRDRPLDPIERKAE